MDVHTVHNVLIFLHAASGTISFFAGSVLIFSPRHASNRQLFGLYAWFLLGLVVFLMGAILVYWMQYSMVERITFTGLLGLGIYMLYRARSANQLQRIQPDDWKHGYIEHIGFTLISLFEGLVIVTALNSGSPGLLVVFLTIFGVLLGRRALGFAQELYR